MAYVGPPSNNSYTSFEKQTITGNGGQTYTLSRSVTSSEEIEVYVNNVRQEPGVAYTASGTSLNMTGNVASTDSFYLVYQGKALQTKSVPDNSISSGKIASGAVTTAKIADDAVTTAKLATPIGIETTSSTFKMTDLSTNAFYRSGTWTPILTDGAATDTSISTHTGTPQNQLGWYERVGDVVTVNWYYQTPGSSFSYTNGSNGTGHLRFTGLPFRVANLSGYYPVASCGYFSTWNGWSAGYTPMGLGFFNEKYVACYYAVAGGTSALSSNYHSAVNSSSIWSLTYRTDEA